MSKNAQEVKTPPDVAGETREGALQAAEVLAQEHLAGWQRARADYENLQKRLSQERREAFERGTQTCLLNVVDAIEHLDTAMAQAPNDPPGDMRDWLEGLRHVQRKFHQFFVSEGIELVAPKPGETRFDPAHHEAVAEEPSEHPEGIVTALVARGYAREGRVIRPARVKVSQGRRQLEREGKGE